MSGKGALTERDVLARIMDPVAYDPRAVAVNLGQMWDRTERQMTAEMHADRVLEAGYARQSTGGT